jgi:hypothetical protein
MGFGKTRFRKRDSEKRDSEAEKTGFGKRDSENGTRKNGIRNRQKLDSENEIRKTGFKKWDSKNSRSPSSVKVGLQADRAWPGKNGIISVSALQLQLKSFKPINWIHCHPCGFHFYVYDMSKQVEAHHYCMHYNQDMR